MGWLAIGAGVAFGLALGFLSMFFMTKNQRYDRIAEWAFVVFAILAVPTILAVGDRLSDGGLAAQAATVIGVVGVVVVGVGELGSTLKLIDFRRIAPVMSAGFFAFIGWIGLASVLALTSGELPVELGWFGLAVLVLGVVIVGWMIRTPGVMSGEREPERNQLLAFFVPMIGIVAWMAWLGLSL